MNDLYSQNKRRLALGGWVALVAMLIVALAGCTSSAEAPQPDTGAPEPSASVPEASELSVVAVQTECCYAEGSVGFLEVTDTSGVAVGETVVAITPGFTQEFPAVELSPGQYHVTIWQEACGMICTTPEEAIQYSQNHGDRLDECVLDLAVDDASAMIELVAEWAPGEGCSTFGRIS